MQTDKPKSCGLCCTRLANFGVKIGHVQIIEKINLHVHCGELTVFVGPNGAGKTTLLKAILGELPHSGRLSFFHADQSEATNRPRIGYMPQKFELDVNSPVAVMDLFATALSRWPVWLGGRRKIAATTLDALAAVQAEQLAFHRLGELSIGQLQRVLLALALTPTPDILLLDEPTAGMDPTGAAMFYRTISKLRNEYDLSIIMVSHDISVAAGFADRMIFINGKIICDGPPQKALADRRVTELMGLNFSIPESPPDNNFNTYNIRHQECDTRYPRRYPERGP